MSTMVSPKFVGDGELVMCTPEHLMVQCLGPELLSVVSSVVGCCLRERRGYRQQPQMANNMTSPILECELVYQLIDHEKNLLRKSLRSVSPATRLAHLRKDIFDENANLLREHSVDVPQLTLWKILNPPQIAEDEEDNTFIINRLLEAFPGDARTVFKDLNTMYKVDHYFKEKPLEGHLHLIVQVPPIVATTLTGEYLIPCSPFKLRLTTSESIMKRKRLDFDSSRLKGILVDTDLMNF
jgi:hypothetical protein